MFESFFDPNERRRKKQLKRAPAGSLKTYLSTQHPKKSVSIVNTPLLAVDFETTGLSAKNEHILSIGFVKINSLAISLSSARHQVIKVEKNLDPCNVVIHQITDTEKNNGVSLETGIADLLENLRGRVLLAHHARSELKFINVSCKKIYGIKPSILMIDTIELAARRLEKKHKPIKPKDLRLFNLRREYGLPKYPAHNALYDAISTAELFLAEINDLPKKRKTPLSELLVKA